jgi:hypothetical protein
VIVFYHRFSTVQIEILHTTNCGGFLTVHAIRREYLFRFVRVVPGSHLKRAPCQTFFVIKGHCIVPFHGVSFLGSVLEETVRAAVRQKKARHFLISFLRRPRGLKVIEKASDLNMGISLRHFSTPMSSHHFGLFIKSLMTGPDPLRSYSGVFCKTER